MDAAISTLSIEVGRLNKRTSSEDVSGDEYDQRPVATATSADANDLEKQEYRIESDVERGVPMNI